MIDGDFRFAVAEPAEMVDSSSMQVHLLSRQELI